MIPPPRLVVVDWLYFHVLDKIVCRKSNALRSWHFVLFAEGEEKLVGDGLKKMDIKSMLLMVWWDEGRYIYDRIFVF